MTARRRTANLAAVVLPFAAFVIAVPLLWNQLVSPLDLAILVVAYVVNVGSVTIGFHRLLTHRAFATHRSIDHALAVLGSMAVQGPVISWVSDHRKHHAYTDAEGDPHSPHVGEGGGLRGLWHAHVGWLFTHVSGSEAQRFAPDLLEDRGMRAINRAFAPLTALSLLIPFAIGWLVAGTLEGAALAFFWGSLVRVFFVHHVAWSTNSICHYFGRRRFDTADKSTNVPWLALPSLGEAWHHNHHAFPRSAMHGLRWWEIDVSGLIIRAMERTGLAWNVVRIDKQRQAAKISIADAPAGADRRRVNPLVYWTTRALMQPVFSLAFRLTRRGIDQIPRRGPMILAANHRSVLDPIIIGLLARRPVYYMAKKELFRKRRHAWLLSALGAFPVDRGGGDQQAMSTAQRILERGDCLAIFPEGRCVPAGPLERPRRGVGRLALATGVAVVPVAISGSEMTSLRRFPPGAIRVQAGAPLRFAATGDATSAAAASQTTEDVWAAVTEQWETLSRTPTRDLPARRTAARNER